MLISFCTLLSLSHIIIYQEFIESGIVTLVDLIENWDKWEGESDHA